MKKWANQKGYPLVTVTEGLKDTNQMLLLEQRSEHQEHTVTKQKPDYWLSDKTLTINFEAHADTEAILLNTRAVW